MRTFLIKTFGCQMNAHDSEKILAVMYELGFEKTDDEQQADIVIFNTCAIRENAENKVYGNLGILKHIKKSRPDMKIILCGCMVQQREVFETISRKYPFVDVVFGTFNLHEVKSYVQKCMDESVRVLELKDGYDDSFKELPYERENRFKASVNIMYGCDNFCAYCIVPYVRGREKSRPPAEIVNEVKSLVADGVKEIMLLGQNVNSYGKSFGFGFDKLLDEIARIEGLERIRFMTSHPKDLSDSLIETMVKHENICKHFHLPLQSGSNNILKAMNRRYTREHFYSLTEKLKKNNIAITTDVIVGFPGETEEDFNHTLDMVLRVGFSGAYTFIFSKRKGTPAYEMDNVVPQEIVSRRFSELTERLNDILLKQNQELLGKTVKVLVEERNAQKEGFLTGRTDDARLVHFKADAPIGEILPVLITEATTFYVVGEGL